MGLVGTVLEGKGESGPGVVGVKEWRGGGFGMEKKHGKIYLLNKVNSVHYLHDHEQ